MWLRPMGPAPVWMLACRDRLWGPDKHLLRHPGVPGPGSADPGGLYTGCGLVGVGRAALRNAGGRGEHWSWAAGASRWGWGGGGLGTLLSPLFPQCPFPGDTEEEVFDCIVNADAPYPRFLSAQGLELIQKVITAGAGLGSAVAPRGPSPPIPSGPCGPACWGNLGRWAVPGAECPL